MTLLSRGTTSADVYDPSMFLQLDERWEQLAGSQRWKLSRLRDGRVDIFVGGNIINRVGLF